ncbi:MAG: restriction endonuclease [Gemmatimonadaceae bacterium]|jgi:hypothetical protein|nr:restriction endonuclease [Gemmatimonadaceae bacterium]
MTSAWREFQDLVGRIEQIAAKHGAQVKSPDRVPDLVTGTLREVDASIRQRVGTASVLITVECRRHSTPQDVTWIEQLAAKRRNIGAALTIAVSSSGFTSEATLLASREGIALRTVEQLPEADLQQSIAPVTQKDPSIEIVALGFSLRSSPQVLGPSDLPAAIQQRLEVEPNNALIFRDTALDRMASLNDIFRMAYNAYGTRVFDGIPHDGSWAKKRVTLDLPDDILFVDSPDMVIPIASITLEVKMSIRSTVIPADIAVQYSGGTDASTIRHAEFQFVDDAGDIRLHVQSESREAEPEIGVHIRGQDGVLRPAKLELLPLGGHPNPATSGHLKPGHHRRAEA